MKADGLQYADRHGYAWRVQVGRFAGGRASLSFTNEDVHLEAAVPGSRLDSLDEAELKELFCDAERVVVLGGETWYVGYRARPVGRQGRFQSGLCTRFRSGSGDVRYARDMLDFRHMPEASLRERLTEALTHR